MVYALDTYCNDCQYFAVDCSATEKLIDHQFYKLLNKLKLKKIQT